MRIVRDGALPAGLEMRLNDRGALPHLGPVLELISPTHKRTEGRAPVWGSEFTSKRRRTTGGVQQKLLLG